MLRITELVGTGGKRVLKLEGKLVGPWVDELARTCTAPPGPGTPPALDLSALSFADGTGLKLLWELLQRGCELTACSGLVMELLHGARE
jgi:hypothetical protein